MTFLTIAVWIAFMWFTRRQKDVMSQTIVWKEMWEGLKRDMYRRILINHTQVPTELAAERAKKEPLDEIERHIELWGRYDVHRTCDCGVPLGVWKQMVAPEY